MKIIKLRKISFFQLFNVLISYQNVGELDSRGGTDLPDRQGFNGGPLLTEAKTSLLTAVDTVEQPFCSQ